MRQRTSELLSKAQAQRVRASRLLLVALVKEEELPLDEAASRLHRWMNRIRQVQPSFFFDLGWHEDLATGFHSLANLNWVSAHRSGLMYKATDVGITHVDDHRGEVERAIGVPLDELYRIAYDHIEAKGLDSHLTVESGEVTLLCGGDESYVTIDLPRERSYPTIVLGSPVLDAVYRMAVDSETSRMQRRKALGSCSYDMPAAQVDADCMHSLLSSARRFRTGIDEQVAAHAVSFAPPLPQ